MISSPRLLAFWLLLHLSVSVAFGVDADTSAEPLAFTLQRTVARQGFDGQQCWVHARAGAIPAADPGQPPTVVMTLQRLLLSGSDVFYPLHQMVSDDLAASWSDPVEIASFSRQRVESESLPTGADIAPQLIAPGDETTVCDFTPKWHAASQRLLGIGQTVWYRDNRVMHKRPRGIAYAVYDPNSQRWSDWDTVALPEEEEFQDAGAGSGQVVHLPGGDVLIPFSFKAPHDKQYSTAVCRCRFDGHSLQYIEHGNAITVDVQRGLYEPSLTYFNGRYLMTLRNDDHGYVSVSDDGLNFSPPQRWTFDDGSDLGNYNTQQHWVRHSDGLFLVYTRRGAANDHVFRHRAPLFIARIDPNKLQVIRDSEQILVPQRGARLGNFAVTEVSPQETWVTVSEWMQPAGVEKHGSDNSIFIAKLQWNRPNESIADTANVSNARQTIQPYYEPPPALAESTGEYRSPLIFADGSRVQTADHWQRRRQEIATQWEQLLGKWPPLIQDGELEVLDSQRRENFTQQQVRLQWTPAESTKGYLLIPDGDGPHPAVITVFYEPETSIGQGTADRDFGLQLARRGFVVLSIGTTEATAAKTYSLYHPSIDDAQVQPLSMLGYAAANAWHALANHERVDSQRIGIVGHSFGGKWAMFASCLFDKFACAAWSDPGIVFDEARPSVNYWEPWYLGYHQKPWRPRGLISDDNPARGLYPQLTAAGRDLHELHALMAPRPFLVSGGSEDPLQRWTALNHSIAVNRLLGHDNRVAMTNRPDHSPNDSSNAVIDAFFEHFLKPPAIENRLD